ncbi:dihydrouridine synthase-domain-containing protein [Gongronella butleri]|nr:dihydrouridine synthase-domain-containing protein [Gongronella butleri]
MASSPIKLKGYEFFQKTLKSPRFVVAPMVEQSELAWRLLSRRHNASLCYTPMFHARLFSEAQNTRYRKEQWTTNDEDRPVVVQFCANDPDILLAAAKLVEDDCDAVDLNLGCPQGIARKGHYGSFLQDEWELIEKMVKTLDTHLKVPVTVKIRVFPTVEKTVEYAKMIEAAGAQMLTVHGRLREQKGHITGLADWDKIKAVKDAVKIPVLANGNILYYDDIQRCIEHTGVDGVMSAEGNLYNPALFNPKYKDLPPLSWEIAKEYLEICKDVDARGQCIKAHLFKIFHASLPIHTDLRQELAKCHEWQNYWDFCMNMKERLIKDQEQGTELDGKENEKGIRQYSHWRCQVTCSCFFFFDFQTQLGSHFPRFDFFFLALHPPQQAANPQAGEEAQGRRCCQGRPAQETKGRRPRSALCGGRCIIFKTPQHIDTEKSKNKTTNCIIDKTEKKVRRGCGQKWLAF